MGFTTRPNQLAAVGVVANKLAFQRTGILRHNPIKKAVVQNGGLLFAGEPLLRAALAQRSRRESIGCFINLNPEASGSITAGNIDAVSTNKNRRRRNNRHVPWNFPKNFSKGGNPGHSPKSGIDIGFFAMQHHRHNGGVRHFPAVGIRCRPNGFSGSTINRHH